LSSLLLPIQWLWLDDINLQRNEFGRKSGEPLEFPLGIPVFNDDVATLDVTEVTQSLEEGRVQLRIGRVAPYVANSSDLGRLLRFREERRKREAESENDRESDQPHAAGSLAEGHYAHQRPGLDEHHGTGTTSSGQRGRRTSRSGLAGQHALLDHLIRPL